MTLAPCFLVPCGAQPGQARAGGCRHMVGREPKLLEENLGVGRCSVVLKADALARISHELPPAQREASLDADPRPDTRWQHLLLVRRILPRKPFHAWHGNHPGGDSILLQS